MSDTPSAYELWVQAGGDRDAYRQLLRDHGLLSPGNAEPLPCGWPTTAGRTPADEISQAAATLRETAVKATEGPWEVRPGNDVSSNVGREDGLIIDGGAYADSTVSVVYGAALHADAAWIALMHPGVAEPLAAWLESWDGFNIPESAPHSDDWEHALKVSRAINTNREGT